MSYHALGLGLGLIAMLFLSVVTVSCFQSYREFEAYEKMGLSPEKQKMLPVSTMVVEQILSSKEEQGSGFSANDFEEAKSFVFLLGCVSALTSIVPGFLLGFFMKKLKFQEES